MTGLKEAPPGPRPSLLDRIAGLPALLQFGAAAAFFLILSFLSMRGDSLVNDEIAHLPAGWSYWRTGDFRLNPEHPPLSKLLAALPLLAMSPRWPEEDPVVQHWRIGEQWRFGYVFLFQSGNDADRLLFWGRVPMLLWGLILIALSFTVGREIFGPRAGLAALILTSSCPEILAHSHLVNTDAAAAACLFLSIVAFWKLTQRPTALRAAFAGAALAAALTVKFSALMLLPALFWTIFIAAWWRWEDLDPEEKTRSRRWKEIGRWTGCLAVAGVVAWLGIWAVYGFRYAASPDPAFQWDWTFGVTGRTMIGRCVAFARDHRMLPEAFLYGFSYMHENAQGREAFAFGRYSSQGWLWYFPAAYLVKTPLVLMVLTLGGSAAALKRNLLGRSPEFFLLIPLILYWGLAIGSGMNIGIRHILPVTPLMIVLGARLVSGWAPRTAGVLLLCALAGAVAAAPTFLSDFNVVSRLIWRRDQMLSDSSLDWGQDLGRLKSWMDRNGVPELKLSYRGNDSPRRHGLRHLQLRGSNMYTDYEPEWRWASSIEPGDWVAISATNLCGVLFPDKDYYLQKFKDLTPAATVGGSILIYRIPPGWSWKF
jgi:4-amino-4-deoxy-L-arabinose transferase-like glycosyltransferase